ncbi:hypothetical protein ACGFJC_39155 [Nonomuraea fuscirosea]|uniref:hypothetical protein n=1 Tax=Nonomuraea fuscirosea TaxID=1291556 RepID=UPI00348CEF35
MGDERKPAPAWAVRLKAERNARFWSQKEMARQLHEAAPPEVEATFPSRASVIRLLRRPLRAVPLLTDVLSRYDTTHARELALYLSWLAVALADANEPEEAARQARRMLEMSAHVASDRISLRAKVVLDRLVPHREVREVRELLAGYPSDA